MPRSHAPHRLPQRRYGPALGLSHQPFQLAAKTFTDTYKDRWQIEIFFRFIKQNLKIKAYIGNSENALLTQIYATLIFYLLLCYLKILCN
jgi:IS4 transposase